MYFQYPTVNNSSVIVLAFMTYLLYHCTYNKVLYNGHVPNENKSINIASCTNLVISAS